MVNPVTPINLAGHSASCKKKCGAHVANVAALRIWFYGRIIEWATDEGSATAPPGLRLAKEFNVERTASVDYRR